MAARRTSAALVFLALIPAAAVGQESTDGPVVRARVVNEVGSIRSNPGRLFAADTQTASWNTSDFAMASVNGSWSAGSRLRLGGAVAVYGDTGRNEVQARVRESYARVSVADWLDVEGGKRILKWGTGYAFTPTGVLDPPRNPADPGDRLGVNEGVVYGGAHMFRGDTVLSIVAASPDTWRTHANGAPHAVGAARLRTLVRGVELAVIASAADITGPSWGVNVTHVIGTNLEWHGELLVHRGAQQAFPGDLGGTVARSREVSAVVGCQYTFNVGVNVVLEYYHDGNGLGRDAWRRLTDVTSTIGLSSAQAASGVSAVAAFATAPGLRHFAFVRAAPAAAEPKFFPEMLAIVGLDDGSVTLVPGVTWTAQVHVQLYARGVIITGPPGSVALLSPSRGELQIGVSARF